MANKSETGNLFSASQQREDSIKQMIEKERAATAAKSAKLKALRLAKEAADAEAARLLPPAPAAKKRAPPRNKN
jgi:hypothetical protein